MALQNGLLTGKSKIRIGDLQAAKKLGEKWVMLTSYDVASAKIFNQAKIPVLLVGDSASQMVLGHGSTLPVKMDEMISLARAVSSGCDRSLVIADLPFGSYQESPQEALRNATRFMKESLVHGVKLEGGREYYDHVKLLTRAGIPVMAHVGFTPQSEHTLGGFKIQGRSDQAIDKIIDDALTLQQAGAFACVVELVPSRVGQRLTDNLSIPTIGIGAGPSCDAQVMVWHDLVGFSPPNAPSAGYLTDSASKGRPKPKFVKQYANIGQIIHDAAVSYADEVRKGVYPSEEHEYN